MQDNIMLSMIRTAKLINFIAGSALAFSITVSAYKNTNTGLVPLVQYSNERALQKFLSAFL